MNLCKNLLFCFLLISKWTYQVSAQEPHWVKHPPSGSNTCLYAVGRGRTLQEARIDMLENALYQKKVLVSTEQVKKLEQVAKNNHFTLEETFTEVVRITGEAQFIDGLSEIAIDYTHNKTWVLGQKSYDFQTCAKPTYINAGWRAFMPGAAQYHKRQRGAWKWLGGGATLAVGSLIVFASQANHFDNLAASNLNNPANYNYYRDRKLAFQTGSNISLAVLGILYGINLVHAFAVPGELRYSFFKTNHAISIEPLAAFNTIGLNCHIHLN